MKMMLIYNEPLQLAFNYEKPKVKPMIKNHKRIGYTFTYKVYRNANDISIGNQLGLPTQESYTYKYLLPSNL